MSDETPTLTLIARLQFLADTMEIDCRRGVGTKPSAEIDSTLKMVADFREAAGQLEEASDLISAILHDKGATLADYERDALTLRKRIEGSGPMPTGITMEWLQEVSE